MRQKLSGLMAAAALALVTVACGQSDPGITTAVKSKLASDDTVKASQIDVDTTDRVVTLKGQVDNAALRARAVELARTTDGVRDVVDQLTVASAAAATSGVGDAMRDAGRAAGDAGRAIGGAGREVGREAKEAGREIGRDSKEAGREVGRDAKGAARDAGRDAKEAGRDAGREAKEAGRESGNVMGDPGITSAVKTKMLADTAVGGLDIDVDTDNGIVTLTGDVKSAAEKRRAVAIAKETSGVKSVVDRLKIAPK